MNKNVTVFKNFETPKDEGMYFRLLCLNGKAKGVSYFLMGSRIVLGRAETTDIQIFDLKSSREHAEISRIGNDLVITDLNSQNGMTINDLKVKQHNLKDGDKIIIGQTVYKFSQIKVSDPVKKRQQQSMVQKQQNEEQKVAKKRKSPVLLIVVVLGGLAIFFLDSQPGGQGIPENKNQINTYKKQLISDDFVNEVNKKKVNEDKEVKEKLKIIYNLGLREFREGNYFRAIKEFNRALAMKPDDAQAQFYLRKAKSDLDEIIKKARDKADRDYNSLKFQSSSVSYCSIIRILHNYPEDERRKLAEQKITDIEGKLGLEKGEIKCIEK